MELAGDPFVRGRDPVGENQRLFIATAGKASGLIETIPRLSTVAAMIRAFPTSDASVCNKKPRTVAARIEVGASLLRVATLSRVLLRHGVEPEAAAREIAELLPNSADCLRQSVAMMPYDSPSGPTKPLLPGDLRPGMVVARSVATPSAGTLLRDGRRLDERLIGKISSLFQKSSPRMTIEVTHESWLAFREVVETNFSI